MPLSGKGKIRYACARISRERAGERERARARARERERERERERSLFKWKTKPLPSVVTAREGCGKDPEHKEGLRLGL